MGDFSSEIRQRVSEAHRSIGEAVAAGDEYLAQILQTELEGLRRLAAEHQVAVD